MTKKQKSTQIHNAWNSENATILSAMEYLTPTDDSGIQRRPTLLTDADDVLHYLEQRLSLNRTQVLLLTACTYCTLQDYACDLHDFTEMLSLHPMRTMEMKKEFLVLEDMGYLYSTERRMDTEGWKVTKHAMEALESDKPFDLTNFCLESNMEFLAEASKYLNPNPFMDGGDLGKALRQLMKINRTLPVVRNVKKLYGNENEREMWLFLRFMTVLAIDGDNYVDPHDFEMMFRNRDIRQFVRSVQNGTHLLVKNKYIEPYNEDGLARCERWVLSRKAWSELLENDEEVKLILNNANQITKDLTQYTDLQKRPLFFSGKLQDQVSQLEELLGEEKLREVQTALQEQGMPKGFCCLLYGAPGTGKTELVQQLAIATGRHIMQIDIASMRDKYVGESEKRLQAVFDSYRALVRTQPKAPILFFNEADAIFGNRMENTQHSVDKMENAMQNILLQEMERLEGILICTTNLTSNIDKAFDRRFLYKIEFTRPPIEARKKIWHSMLAKLTDEQTEELARRFDFSGGQIQNICRKQIINSIFSGKSGLDFDRVVEDCSEEILNRNNGTHIGFCA